MWIAAILASVLGQSWTWTLYEDAGPLVLAQEIPDTPALRATLECQAGAGVARVTIYRDAPPPGFVTLAAGQASAAAEAAAGPDGGTSVMLRIEHPASQAFGQTGRLSVTASGQAAEVVVEAEHLAKLRRFAELCGG